MKTYKNIHTASELKKMSTEQMHRLYTHLTGIVLFNPYEERDLMAVTISGIEHPEYNPMAWVISMDKGMEAQSEAMRIEASQKYSTSQVTEMRGMYEQGDWSVRAIASEFGGSIKGTENVIKGKTYKNGGRSMFVAYMPAKTSRQIISEYTNAAVDTSWF